MSTMNDATAVDYASWFQRIVVEIDSVVRGKRSTIELITVAALSGGHVLLEDTPGVGKTVLAKTLATVLGGAYQRVQCTPDLLPADITGVSVFDPQTGQFRFHEGPVFANVLLADEVNRATAKTQSALLEAMAEGHVTVDGSTMPLPRPFFVIATQNPIELEGTYRLPEAQLDRFAIRTGLGLPDELTEIEILRSHSTNSTQAATARTVVTASQFGEMIAAAETVHAADAVLAYVAAIAHATRIDPMTSLGASPRASISLLRAARVSAASQGRPYVVSHDIERLARPVLEHRIILSQEAMQRGVPASEVIDRAVASVPSPELGAVR